MGGTLRQLLNLLAIALALALLGLLLLVSSGGDDRRQRMLDHDLRELREIGTAMQSEVVTADGLELDVSDRFRALELAFATATEQASGHAGRLEAQHQDAIRRVRDLAFRAFNFIDRGARPVAEKHLAERLRTLVSEAAALRADVASFSRDQRLYLQQRDTMQERSRELVRQLRQRGFEAAADAAFAGLQQALDRVRRTVSEDTAPVRTTLLRLGQITIPAQILRDDLHELIGELEALLGSRTAVNAHLARVTASSFPETAEALRESVTGAYLFTLRTVGEARVLLNVYTVLMLMILVYFGRRLQFSHRILNRSHALLEKRVTERTRELETAYHDLQESQVQLVQAEKMSSLGQLVAGVVHEINTPLLYVMNNTDMTHESIAEVRQSLEPLRHLVECLQQPDFPRDRVRALLEDMRSSTDLEGLHETLAEIGSLTADSTEGLNDIDALVKSLKDFSRLDRATYDRFDVREGLDKTLLITKNLLKYGIVVERDFREVPPILCAPSRVNQVFINLITNAAQAMDGSGTLKISTYADRDGWVHIEVRDTGCGISEEHLAKVTDPFFTTKPVGQGTGLGLSIVRKIMDEHQGRLLIDSREGVGTQITLSFPVDGALHEAEPADESEAA